MIQISRAARRAIAERLADPQYGFNPRLTAALLDAEIVTAPTGVKLPISFTKRSYNFFQANVGPEDLEGSTAYTFPFLTVYSKGIRHQNLEKWWTFAGTAEFGINGFWSWPGPSAAFDMETLGDCFEEAVIGSFNAPEIAEWSTAARQPGIDLVYNGEIGVERPPMAVGGENWMQVFSATLGLDVHVR